MTQFLHELIHHKEYFAGYFQFILVVIITNNSDLKLRKESRDNHIYGTGRNKEGERKNIGISAMTQVALSDTKHSKEQFITT